MTQVSMYDKEYCECCQVIQVDDEKYCDQCANELCQYLAMRWQDILAGEGLY